MREGIEGDFIEQIFTQMNKGRRRRRTASSSFHGIRGLGGR